MDDAAKVTMQMCPPPCEHDWDEYDESSDSLVCSKCGARAIDVDMMRCRDDRRRTGPVLREELPRYDAAKGWSGVFDAVTALLALVKDLTLAIGDDPGCRKLTVPCTCGKAKKLTAAHQRGSYIVRAIEPISSQSQKD